jgi:hypothetical protein
MSNIMSVNPGEHSVKRKWELWHKSIFIKALLYLIDDFIG